MRIRIGFIAVLACLALAMVGAPAAGAASGGVPQTTDAGPLVKKSITGKASNGKQFKGSYGIYKFVVKNGKVWSVGSVSGKIGNRHVKRGNVMMPASLKDDSGIATAAQTCSVLHLVLGPINLNLLGLHVTLGGGAQANQPIVLDITAERGGGLLGDLLCGLTDSLGGTGILGQLQTQLQQLATTLNSLIALLGGL